MNILRVVCALAMMAGSLRADILIIDTKATSPKAGILIVDGRATNVLIMPVGGPDPAPPGPAPQPRPGPAPDPAPPPGPGPAPPKPTNALLNALEDVKQDEATKIKFAKALAGWYRSVLATVATRKAAGAPMSAAELQTAVANSSRTCLTTQLDAWKPFLDAAQVVMQAPKSTDVNTLAGQLELVCKALEDFVG